jgi:hypothetical protein
MSITTQLLPRTSTEPSSLRIKFSTYIHPSPMLYPLSPI